MLLPEDADREAIDAAVENGVLTVSIPKLKKAEPKDSTKLIEIR